MHQHYRLFLFILLIASACLLFPVENSYHWLGAQAGRPVVLTTSSHSPESIRGAVATATEIIAQQNPLRPVLVAQTVRDTSVLPAEFRRDHPVGTRALIQLLREGEPSAVILVEAGEGPGIRIVNGTRGYTSPRWLLQSVVSSLAATDYEWTLAQTRQPLYRLGWTERNERLEAFLKSGIPALVIQWNDPDPLILSQLVLDLPNPLPDHWDRHFLIFTLRGTLFFIGEEVSLFIVISAFALILLFLFVFGFLFGKRSEQRLRDFLRLWWLPFMYLAVTTLSLTLAGNLVKWLFAYRLGNPEGWRLMPAVAFTGKILITWFFVTLIGSFNQLIRFPRDSFIYGYIASIVCLVNLIVFASLDFSLAMLFLSVYFISFVMYRLDHPVLHLPAVILLAIPFVPYIQALVTADSTVLAPLVQTNTAWNLRMAFFIMPFQLFLSRFLVSLGHFGRSKSFYLPVNLMLSFVLFVVGLAGILFLPVTTENRPLNVSIRQYTDTQGSRIETQSLAWPDQILAVPALSQTEFQSITADQYITVDYSSRTFLERRLVFVRVTPRITADLLEVRIERAQGFPIFDASVPFERQDGGRTAVFRIKDSRTRVFELEFSTERDAIVDLMITVVSRENPAQIAVPVAGIIEDFALVASRRIPLVFD